MTDDHQQDRFRLSDVVAVPLGAIILVVLVLVSLPAAVVYRLRLRRLVRRQRAELGAAIRGEMR